AALIVETPQLARKDLAVASEEGGGAGRLVLVKRLAFGIGLRVACGADVVKFEIGVSGHRDDALGVRLQVRWGQLLAGQVQGEYGSGEGIIRRADAQVSGRGVRIGLR